jgi:hypothetical protein
MRKPLLVLVGFAATLAAASQAAPRRGSRPAPAPSPTPAPLVLPPTTCADTRAALDQLDPAIAQAFEHGDRALVHAERFVDGGTLALNEANELYDETTAMDSSLEKAMETIASLDRLFPTGQSVELQLIHLKIGLAQEPITGFRRKMLPALMGATLCDLDDTLAACQARRIAPLYLNAGVNAQGEPTRVELYKDLKARVTEMAGTLRTFLLGKACP